MKKKRCTKCGEVKTLSEFHKDRSKKDGHECRCKECRRIPTSDRVGRKRIDETGKRYGKLTVIGYKYRDQDDNPYRDAMWLCKCDCGGEKLVSGSHLRRGEVRSCGCLWSAKQKPKGVAAFNSLYATWRANAKLRGHAWKLTKKQVHSFTKQHCTYCGEPPRHISCPKGCNGSYTYNGMDRVDNDKGYVIDNVVACCGTCNRAKGTKTIDEFRNFITRVHEYWAN